MEFVDLVARLVLSLVFIVSGIAKLRDKQGTHKAVLTFGVPRTLVEPTAIGLPALELVLAVLLVPAPTAWWGGLGALLLLLVFTIAIAYQLARGRHPECHCFGELGGGPIGARTIVRNGALIAVAGVVLALSWDAAQPRPESLVDGLTPARAFLGAGVLVVVLLNALLTYAVYKRLSSDFEKLSQEFKFLHGRAKARTAGKVLPPTIGEPAPVVELPDLAGNIIDLSTMRGRDLLLVFVRPGCSACHELLPSLTRRDAAPLSADLVIISRGTAEENQEFTGRARHILLSPNLSVNQAFGVGGTPSAIFIDDDGNIASEVLGGVHAVRAVIDPELATEQRPTGWRRSLTITTQRAITALRGA